MAKEKILIVDDEKDIVELVKYHVEKSGYKALTAGSGGEALDIAAKQQPALIVLDIMLPGFDGYEVCRILKRNENTKNIPIIMLTAKAAEEDTVTGLKAGADDYLSKPFSPKILMARIDAVLRRSKQSESSADVLTECGISINLTGYEATLDGKLIPLTKIEFSLLSFLMKNKGKVYNREQIISGAWSYETAIVDRAVDVHIRHLREKFGKSGKLIKTVHGVGYKFSS
ncbi:MAG: DNA-binding response regulator [Candidatus Firestonebacteria bacterium RIFOXYC2_FULL_39_67]|nr:MAG: DNA-binding response regulator [Candidatus Firestonebacteria bacterium RIFOXYD2_FULL_39_29]OGF56453.1 MAG: DNA-binding response regulator [Candidatus Firestonebacteria bacterium RIFOXYC2_FULL_39_67]OGF56993.1 MAG: DNA-binding response regulator [Candidatus Firestonebacteria bacterium RifOxyC12_full_39_7]